MFNVIAMGATNEINNLKQISIEYSKKEMTSES